MSLKHAKKRMTHFFKANLAVSALEYAVLVGVVVVAIGGALAIFSNSVSDALNAAGARISGVPGLSP